MVDSVSQFRSNLRRIGTAAFRLEDIMYCMSTCSTILEEKRTLLDTRRNSLQQLYENAKETDPLDNVVELMHTLEKQIADGEKLIDAERKAFSEALVIETLAAAELLNEITSKFENLAKTALRSTSHTEIVRSMHDVLDKDKTVEQMLRSLQKGASSSGKGGLSSFFPAVGSAGRREGGRLTRSSTGKLSKKDYSEGYFEEALTEFDEDLRKAVERSKAENKVDRTSSDYWQQQLMNSVDLSDSTTKKPPSFTATQTHWAWWSDKSNSDAAARQARRDKTLSDYNAEQERRAALAEDAEFEPASAAHATPRQPRRIVMSQEEDPIEDSSDDATPQKARAEEVVDMCSPSSAGGERAPVQDGPGLGGFLSQMGDDDDLESGTEGEIQQQLVGEADDSNHTESYWPEATLSDRKPQQRPDSGYMAGAGVDKIADTSEATTPSRVRQAPWPHSAVKTGSLTAAGSGGRGVSIADTFAAEVHLSTNKPVLSSPRASPGVPPTGRQGSGTQSDSSGSSSDSDDGRDALSPTPGIAAVDTPLVSSAREEGTGEMGETGNMSGLKRNLDRYRYDDGADPKVHDRVPVSAAKSSTAGLYSFKGSKRSSGADNKEVAGTGSDDEWIDTRQPAPTHTNGSRKGSAAPSLSPALAGSATGRVSNKFGSTMDVPAAATDSGRKGRGSTAPDARTGSAYQSPLYDDSLLAPSKRGRYKEHSSKQSAPEVLDLTDG